MSTPAISIVMFLAAALFGAAGQYLYKSGADAAGGTISSYIVNPRLLAGVVCYVAVMALFVAAFKKGGSLTVLYPIYASTFIWAALIASVCVWNPNQDCEYRRHGAARWRHVPDGEIRHDY